MEELSREGFDFSKEYQLENDRAKLTPLKYSDRKHLLPYSLNEHDLWKYSLVPANGEENLDKYLEIAISAREKEDSCPFLVYDKQSQKFAGSTRFYDIQLQHKTLQLGYTWYGQEFWGTRLNKNCKFLMLDFAFNQLGMERVEFRADHNNARSIAAMKSLGCMEEGILRSNYSTPNGERRNSIILSILRVEWDSEICQKLLNRL